MAITVGFLVFTRKHQTAARLKMNARKISTSLSSGQDYDELNYADDDHRGNNVVSGVAKSHPINLRDPSDVEESYDYNENQDPRPTEPKSNNHPELTASINVKEDASSVQAKKIIKVNEQGDVYTEFGVYLA